MNAAAELWNTAIANVIDAERKATPARMLANVSGKAPRNGEVVENVEGYVVGAAGLEPATLSFEG